MQGTLTWSTSITYANHTLCFTSLSHSDPLPAAHVVHEEQAEEGAVVKVPVAQMVQVVAALFE